MIHFDNPTAFYLIALIPILFLMSFLSQHHYEKKSKLLLGARMYPELSHSLNFAKRKAKWFLQSLVLLSMIIALARPQLGQNQTTIKSQGFELILAVDVSESMLAEDVKPSRLEQAKLELNKLLDLMPGNKVGVLAFAGSSFLLSPLTNDMGAVKMYLDSLSPQMISNQGTSFESAIRAAEESFEKGGATSDSSSRATKVLLIASDGEDHEEGALKAAQDVVAKGIRIFSIAYGTEKGGTIPVRDAMGYLRGNKNDRQGNPIITQVKGEFLKKLATEGKGSFYFSVFGGNHINNLVDDFAELEKADFETKTTIDYDEKFQGFVLLALLLGFWEIFIGERKANFSFWKGRYAQQKMMMVFILFCFILTSCEGGSAGSLFDSLTELQVTDLGAVIKNNKTSKKFKDQSMEENQQGYLEAMKSEPFQPEIQINLGVTYDSLKDNENALKLYKNAEEYFLSNVPEKKKSNWLQYLGTQTSPWILFAAYFNQAQLLGRENKIDDALDKYQLALNLNPESKEVKTNIELLMQQQQKQSKGDKGQGGNSGNQDQKNDDKKQGSNKDNDKDKNAQSKDSKDSNDSEKEKQDQKKNYSSSPKYKPREFKGELNKESVKKIFGEISQQEKKMRAQYSKQNQSKESPREKDW